MSAEPFAFDLDAYEAEAIQAATNLCEGLARTVSIARMLLAHGRNVDLAGLDNGIGLLCAKALDLPHGAGRSVRPHLVALLAETDKLTLALQAQADA